MVNCCSFESDMVRMVVRGGGGEERSFVSEETLYMFDRGETAGPQTCGQVDDVTFSVILGHGIHSFDFR